jgi:hypothetical protein
MALWFPNWEGVVGAGIGIQSLIKRLRIIIGPIARGLLMDAYGLVTGVRIGLGLSILLGGLSLLLQSRLREDAGCARSARRFSRRSARFRSPVAAPAL